MQAFYVFRSNNDMGSKAKDIPRKGIVYLKSDSEQQNTTVFVKRNWDEGYDIRVSDYGTGQFSILRSKSTLYLIDELIAMGHSVIDEDEFNNAFIDAASWILHNRPERSEGNTRPKRQRKAKPNLQAEPA